MAPDRVELLAERARGEDSVVSLPEWIPDRAAVLLTDPAHIQQVLEANQANYRKAAGYREELSAVLGDGLLTSEGDRWARQHRLIRPLFTPHSVQTYSPQIIDVTDELVERWEQADGPIDLLESMKWATLMIIGRAMFSVDMDDHAPAIREALASLRSAFRARTDPAQELDADVAREAFQARGRLDAIVGELIVDRRSVADRPEDLLTRLLEAEDEVTGERMDDDQIRDELMTFLLAGHETTAAALTWTWFCLTRHPDLHRTAHEAATATAIEAPDTRPSDDLSFIEQCVTEAMRLYPPVPVFSREATASDSFDGTTIEAGTQVLISQFVTHRDERFWEDPLVYRPDRFGDDGVERSPYTYFPFGGGPRMCIGRQLATLEASLLLGRVLEQIRLTPASGDPESIGVNSAVTMIPDRDLKMTVERWS